MNDDYLSDYSEYYEEETPPSGVKQIVAGYWTIDTGNPSTTLVLMMYKKPRWITRFLAKWLFEIEWRTV